METASGPERHDVAIETTLTLERQEPPGPRETRKKEGRRHAKNMDKKEDHEESKRNVEKKQEILSEEEGCNWETFDPGQKTVFEQEQRQNDSWKREKKNCKS